MHSSRFNEYRRHITVRWGLPDRDPLDREPPGQRTPGQKTPLDRDPLGKRPHGQRPPPVNRLTDRCENITFPVIIKI